MSDARTAPQPRLIDWYRTPLPQDTLHQLNERSDFWGFLQAGGYLATVLATGTLAVLSWLYGPWWLTVLAVFAHGTVSAFMINGVHELVHGTVFKSRWLNSLFVHLFAFIGWINHYSFWGSHSEHHKYTLHPPEDLEVVLPIKLSFWNYWKIAFCNPWGIKGMIQNNARLAAGRFVGEWETHLFPPEAKRARRAVQRWSLFLLVAHTSIITASLASGYWILAIVISLTPLYGHWLFWLCNTTQHVGLVDKIPDFRLCCRTIYLNPVVQFLYWHMNYHIEHHMYAGVPCYRLQKLHHAIKHDLPPTPDGLVEAWAEIGHILVRQHHDPDYQYVQPLPGLKDETAAEVRTGMTAEQSEAGRQPVNRFGPDGLRYKRWECSVCGFIYDEARGLPEEGIAPGTRWDEIPEDWRCPDCGVAKADFHMVELPDDDATAAATPPGDAQADSGPTSPVVIIGTGMAAYNTAKELREHNQTRPIVMLSRDGGESYAKPNLSNAMTQGKTPPELVNAAAAEMAERYHLDVRPGVSVHRIDRERKVVHTDHGEVAYGGLVLAVGADPIVLPIGGSGADRIKRVNDIASYAAFRDALPDGGRVVILGAGLIGCEFANDLAGAGYSVEVVDLSPAPLSRFLPPQMGKVLAEALAAQGVQWHLEASVRSVERTESGQLAAELTTGEVLKADVVLSAVGLRSRTQLAAEAGLACGRGIQVGATLRTSDPAIYAIGDCAEVDGRVLPFVMPLMEGARSLGRTLAGRETPVRYPVMPVVVKTPSCPLVVCPPREEIEGAEWTLQGEGLAWRAEYRDSDGVLRGFALSGNKVEQKPQLVEQVDAHRPDQPESAAAV